MVTVTSTFLTDCLSLFVFIKFPSLRFVNNKIKKFSIEGRKQAAVNLMKGDERDCFSNECTSKIHALEKMWKIWTLQNNSTFLTLQTI